MFKDKLLEELNNNNHYTVPKYLLYYQKDLGLDANALTLLIYFMNQKEKDIFNPNKIKEELKFNDKELMNAISKLKDKKIISITAEKNDSNIMEEMIDISSLYNIILSKMLNEEGDLSERTNLYETFEKEVGRTLSPMEYEIINSWLDSGIKEDLIVSALKETIFNGVNNLRYVDKILFEWNRKGIKKPSDIDKKRNVKDELKDDETYEYNWLDE